MYKTDKNKYETTARSWTQKYAMGQYVAKAVSEGLRGGKGFFSHGTSVVLITFVKENIGLLAANPF